MTQKPRATLNDLRHTPRGVSRHALPAQMRAHRQDPAGLSAMRAWSGVTGELQDERIQLQREFKEQADQLIALTITQKNQQRDAEAATARLFEGMQRARGGDSEAAYMYRSENQRQLEMIARLQEELERKEALLRTFGGDRRRYFRRLGEDLMEESGTCEDLAIRIEELIQGGRTELGAIRALCQQVQGLSVMLGEFAANALAYGEDDSTQA